MYTLDELCDHDEPGIDVSRLEAGTKLIVKTLNSTYVLLTTETPRSLIARGGDKIPKARDVRLVGSTWGGTTVKLGWIGLDMHMEMHITGTKRVLTTTPVESIRLIGANKDWYYDLP